MRYFLLIFAVLVLIGIGVIPNVDLAQDAGLDIENGIVAGVDTGQSG